MGIFNFSKSTKWKATAKELLEKYDRKEINEEELLGKLGSLDVFYSTPFGDHKDGGKKLFLLPAGEGAGYHPVFSTQERLCEFYESAGRVGYMIMSGPFSSFLETTKTVNDKQRVGMGVIIDPGYHGITIDAPMLEAAINLTK